MVKYYSYSYLESGSQNSELRKQWIELDANEQMKCLLKYTRFKRNLTQKELSDLSGISPIIICKMENGKAKPNIATLEKIAAAAGMKLNIEFSELPKNTQDTCR